MHTLWREIGVFLSMSEEDASHKFLCDRMAGSLCKYLRFMGYDSLSANDLPEGDPKEDTVILNIARNDNRIILTQDAELAARGEDCSLKLDSSDLKRQILQLRDRGLIVPEIRLTRCSKCNSRLISGQLPDCSDKDVTPSSEHISHCPLCNKQYWEGSHTRNMRKVIENLSNR